MMKTRTMKYWMGIDGGGTKTDFQVVSSEGGVLSSLTLGSSNPYQQPVTDICALFERGRLEALELASLDSSRSAEGTIICLGGLNDDFREEIARFSGFGEIKLLNDPLAILELCGGGGCCAILHAGTGSFVAARDSQRKHSLWGGYGHLLREPGSAWDIGRLAVSRALDELAGIEPATPFVERLLGLNSRENFNKLIEFIYGNNSPVTALAGYAPCVMQMLDEGDSTATEIVSRSFSEFGAFASRALLAFFCEEPQALRGISGKLFSNPRALEIMRQVLAQNGLGDSWSRIEDSPIEGIRLMLLKWAKDKLPDYQLRSESTMDSSSKGFELEEALYI